MSLKRLRVHWNRNAYPFLAGLGSAAVVMLAFLIPSLQDQWDRYQSRKVIEEYVTLGDSFYNEDHFQFAEEAFAKAFELSENKRLDVEVKRLKAKVNRIYEQPLWATELPDDFEEIEFQYLLHLQEGNDEKQNRFETLNSYGYYLASLKRYTDADKTFNEALKIDSADALTFINLGNLYDQQNKKVEAEKKYLKAIALDPDNERAHYNLGLLYKEQNKLQEAELHFKKSLQSEPDDKETLNELKEIEKEKLKE